ncbi:hypothetical protein GCM10022240_31430 [Microbacterium kribbense]|uniref:Transcription regulator PadR N-terminal domain-containing protein n=1 Tax=Microbacterium kribbense TaxID=433645 RepID=A0ABP7GZD3_9MICO
MKLEHLLLGVLLMRRRTGYDLKRFMDLQGVFMRPRTQMSQVYRSLVQMAQKGWVTYEVSSRPGAQDAKIYRTTQAGRDEFMAWLDSAYHPTVSPLNFEFRARVFFSGFRDDEWLIALLNAEIEARQRQIAKYRFRDRTIELDPGVDFNLDQTNLVEDFQHESGAAAMDLHVERTIELRDLIESRRARPAGATATEASSGEAKRLTNSARQFATPQ